MAAIGHGRRIDIAPEEALAVARAAQPAAPRPSQPQDGDPHPCERVRVRPADNAKDWVEGEVNFIDAHEVALVRDDPGVGRVAVHFPRLGYDWRRVA
jgi:glutathione S-transferase